jgi:hypothetical protein
VSQPKVEVGRPLLISAVRRGAILARGESFRRYQGRVPTSLFCSLRQNTGATSPAEVRRKRIGGFLCRTRKIETTQRPPREQNGGSGVVSGRDCGIPFRSKQARHSAKPKFRRQANSNSKQHLTLMHVSVVDQSESFPALSLCGRWFLIHSIFFDRECRPRLWVLSQPQWLPIHRPLTASRLCFWLLRPLFLTRSDFCNTRLPGRNLQLSFTRERQEVVNATGFRSTETLYRG